MLESSCLDALHLFVATFHTQGIAMHRPKFHRHSVGKSPSRQLRIDRYLLGLVLRRMAIGMYLLLLKILKMGMVILDC